MSLPLPQFAVSAPGPAPASAQSPADEFVAPDCPSAPGSRTSTPPYEFLSTDSDDATSVHAPPARIAVRVSATVTAIAGTSTAAPRLQIPDCRAPMSPAVGPVSSGLPRPTMKVSLPLPQSTVSVPVPTPDPAQSSADEMVNQQYPSLPGSRTSTPTYGFLSVDTNVAVSASMGAAAAVPPTGSPIMARFGPLNLPELQPSRLSSVQLSTNRVRPDFDIDTNDLCPLFDTSPVSDGDLSLISPATTQESISTDSEGEAESFHSAGVSPATSASMSIPHHTAEMQLLSPLLAPLPSSISVKTDPAMLLQLTAGSCAYLVSVAVPRGAFRCDDLPRSHV